MQDLSMEIRHVDDVEVHEAERADTRGREIQRGGRAESARADEQDARGLDPPLAIERDVGKNEMPAVAEKLFSRQLGQVAHQDAHPPLTAATIMIVSPSSTCV